MTVRILTGDVRERLKDLSDDSVHCVVTSPPYYGLRDYGMVGQIGLEPTPQEYVETMVSVFREVRRVLRKDGTLWLNLGDSYTSGGRQTRDPGQSKLHPAFNGDATAVTRWRPADPPGLKPKDLIGIPWRVAFALQTDGWWLRQDIIWSKPNPMPESVTDRCTKAHEYLFMLTKSARYWYDAAAIAEPAIYSGRIVEYDGTQKNCAAGHEVNDRRTLIDRSIAVGESRNRRSVWTIATQPYSEAHFATFPPALVEPCIKAGCPAGGVVLDPFGGAGTTGLVADRLKRDAILIELNPEYAGMAQSRIHNDAPMFAEVTP